MIINLHKSKLFTDSPESRFAKQYGYPPQLWRELWKRHALMDYSLTDLCDYYEVKTKHTISSQAMQRWLWRTYVYMKAQGVMKMGVEIVSSEFFGVYEWDVVKELTKNIRSSVHKSPKIVI